MTREKELLQAVSAVPHPFVVQFKFAYWDDVRAYLGMDFVGGCDLFTLARSRGPLPCAWVVFYCAEICLALGHIHSFDIIHRDVKPENILIGMVRDCRLPSRTHLFAPFSLPRSRY